MGTRSGIAYVREDESVKSVYCHYDGYPEYNGKLLVNFYDSEDDAKAIVELGSISSLRERLNPVNEHSFEKPEDGTTIVYSRDRGEDLVIETYDSVKDYLTKAPDDYCAEYLYYFREGVWLCYDVYAKKYINLYKGVMHD